MYVDGCAVKSKDDRSPVTEADLAVDAILAEAVAGACPQLPLVTEEREDTHALARAGGSFLLVDPIDGTREFIGGTGEFTINVAIVEYGVPTAGIVYAPAAGRMFVGDRDGFAHEYCEKGSQTPIRVRDCSARGLVAVASRSHLTDSTCEYLDRHGIEEWVPAGSSLKFCLLAAGEADIYPRFGPTMEWDTAAGDAVLRAAGGMVVTPDGAPLAYGKPGLANPDFIACSPAAWHRCGGATPAASL